MSYRPHIARLLIVPVVAGGSVFGQSGTASASELPESTTTDGDATVKATDRLDELVVKYAPSLLEQSSPIETVAKAEVEALRDTRSVTEALPAPEVSKTEIQTATTAAVAKACASADAVSDVVYKVDGKSFDTLQGNTHEGANVRVEFKIAEGCEDTPVGLAVYQAPSNGWDPAKAELQKLVAHQTGTFKADGTTHSLEVKITNCNYQIDFFTGSVLEKLSATNNYSSPVMNLIEFDNGGSKSCDVPPPPPVVVDDCPIDEDARIVEHSFTINGVGGFDDLSSVEAGDTVKVDFTIAEDCEDVQLSLVSYDATDDEFTRDNAVSQSIFDSETGKFDAGKHSMEIVVPDCFFQVDFVKGDVIEQFGPSDSDNYYADQGRLISAVTGGDECEVPETPVTPETPPVEVLPTEITRPAPQQLAVTGVETSDLAMLGAAMMLMGAAFNRAAARARRA